MTSNLRDIEAQACELSDRERAQLALVLIESLETKDDGDIADSWRIEVDRRWAEIENGTAVTIPVAEVFLETRRDLK